ncbi:MAG: ferrous iron transport protein B [Armatimonadia bacterium]
MPKTIVVALAGNPNSGKTTLFNELTGSHQHVGNYPGVTVEKKEGDREYAGHRLHFVDLPGTYSLTAYSLEEVVARNFILHDKPDVVVDVVDASNLERNLYLASMFLELDVPVVLALNMMDVAETKGKQINVELLSELFGLPVVPVVARRGHGAEKLLDAVLAAAEEGRPRQIRINYGPELEQHIEELTAAIEAQRLRAEPEGGAAEVQRGPLHLGRGRQRRHHGPGRGHEREALKPRGMHADLALADISLSELPARWTAIKLLEDDSQVRQRVERLGAEGEALLRMTDAARAHIAEVFGDDPEIALADRRYGFVSGACREAVTSVAQDRRDWSERVDTVLANRVFGLPIFFFLMWVMFEGVFRLGNPLMLGLEIFFNWLHATATAYLPPGQLQSLIADGVVGGVGGVLVFLPNILLLFVAISLFEDSGYMSRAAFVVDRVMHQVGLHGKSFISMLIGFGCSVPAVLATRTLESPRERLVTILVVPLMSCGARLPVYILLTGAFFSPQAAGKVIFAIYALGVFLALLMAKLFSRYLFPGPPTPFVMELPPYRFPTLKGTLIHMWERGWLYVRKAGTTILAMSVVMWFLLSYPRLPADPALTAGQNAERAILHSYAGRLGKTLEPAMKPLGFDYKVATGLFAGLAAKEIIVSTFGTIYSLEGTDEKSQELRSALRADPGLNPLVAFTLMVFVLIYIPCVSTVAAIYKETCSWKWTLFSVGYTCALAWVVGFVVYQTGMLLGLGA